jgi:hypothetical protein
LKYGSGKVIKTMTEGLHNFLNASYKNYGYYSDALIIYPYNSEPIQVAIGDYIVKDTTGYFFPVPQHIFNTLFEKI